MRNQAKALLIDPHIRNLVDFAGRWADASLQVPRFGLTRSRFTVATGDFGPVSDWSALRPTDKKKTR